MTHLPNIITLLRIAGSLGLLLCGVTDVVLAMPSSVTTRPSPSELGWLSLLRPFWIIYTLCGISDIADGWLARKLKCVSKTGALLDSVADICFVACLCPLLLPILELPQWLWLWAGVIVVIKVVNQISAFVMHGRCYFPHTKANKVTGFLLFIAVPITFYTVIPIAIVAAIATFAAIQEGHFIRTNMRKIVSLVFALVVVSCWAQKPTSDSTIYGACIMRDGSVSGINEIERFAMHSVMKFPQATPSSLFSPHTHHLRQ